MSGSDEYKYYYGKDKRLYRSGERTGRYVPAIEMFNGRGWEMVSAFSWKVRGEEARYRNSDTYGTNNILEINDAPIIGEQYARWLIHLGPPHINPVAIVDLTEYMEEEGIEEEDVEGEE